MRPRKIRVGGLMRCCMATIDELPDDTPEEDGHTVACKHCGGPIRFFRGAWEWGHAGKTMREIVNAAPFGATTKKGQE